jgi:hypothetical protein
MMKQTRILGITVGLGVGLILSGCADTDFSSMNPLSWLTSAEADAAPATTQAQAVPDQAGAAAVATPPAKPAATKGRAAATKKPKGKPASTEAQAQPAPTQAQASAVAPVTSAKRIDEPTYIRVQDIGIVENDGPH